MELGIACSSIELRSNNHRSAHEATTLLCPQLRSVTKEGLHRKHRKLARISLSGEIALGRAGKRSIFSVVSRVCSIVLAFRACMHLQFWKFVLQFFTKFSNCCDNSKSPICQTTCLSH